MKFFPFSLEAKPVIEEYLNLHNHKLAVYSFENLYLWKNSYSILCAWQDKSLCIFFQDKIGVFSYFPPLSKEQHPETIQKVFAWMKQKNRKYPAMSRIENIEKELLPFYQNLGYECIEKAGDYLCLPDDMAKLSGRRLKSKRGAYNFFINHHKNFVYRAYNEKDKEACLALQKEWMEQRQRKNQDTFYLDMLSDSGENLPFLLDSMPFLSLQGRVVEIENQIKGFTFGYPINKDVFCILYEVTDLNKRGLAQFIFREFSSELLSYRYINIMDDSYLPNLKKVKLSYHPVDCVISYIAGIKQ
ncbi:MAG: DUF2156 domain-containing protein [Candidatus Brocadiae bacterium]|nr:DUF2156 domain-containing protein [Candidatus Brocadiia bacterium]